MPISRHTCRLLAAALLLGTLSITARGDELADLTKQYYEHVQNGRLAAAETAAREIVRLGESAYRARPGKLVEPLNQLGLALMWQGRFSQAADVYERAARLADRHLPATDTLTMVSHSFLMKAYLKQARYEDALPHAERVSEWSRRNAGEDVAATVIAQCELVELYAKLGEFDKARPICRETLTLAAGRISKQPQLLDRSMQVATSLYMAQKRYEQVEANWNWAYDWSRKKLGNDHAFIAKCCVGLGDVKREQGRWAEAEALYDKAAAICNSEKSAHERAYFAAVVERQGDLRFTLHRYRDARKYFDQALAIRREVYGGGHSLVADVLFKQCLVLVAQHRAAETEPLLKDCVRIYGNSMGPGHPRLAECLAWLACVQLAQGDVEEGVAAAQRAQAIWRKLGDNTHEPMMLAMSALLPLHEGQWETSVDTLRGAIERARAQAADEAPSLGELQDLAAFLAYKAGDDQAALAAIDRAEAAPRPFPQQRFQFQELRACVLWRLGRREEALADLREAIRIAEQLRLQSSGGPAEQATFFGEMTSASMRMVDWQGELGDVAAAHNALERARAQTMLDQLNVRGKDLLAGLSDKMAQQLRTKERAANLRIAKAESRLRLHFERQGREESEEFAELEQEVQSARRQMVAVRQEIFNNSPVYQEAVSRAQNPVTLDELSNYVKSEGAMLLQYAFVPDGCLLFAIAPEGRATVSRLTIAPEQAEALGASAGPLDHTRLRQSLHDGEPGLLDQLSQPGTERQTASRLSALWKTLVPAAQRRRLLAGDVKTLIVIPDGSLTRLPFETLVTSLGDAPTYLLDVGPPVVYASSGSILHKLATTESVKATARPASVLTVGEPDYTSPDSAELDNLLWRARTSRAGVAPIPHSGLESAWVAQVFADRDVSVKRLTGRQATEANVRRELSGRRWIHLACHGFADDAYGNQFGALALSPGRSSEPADDGMLSLAEIYALDLSGCELAVLSACNTNFGPLQVGEGVWALSRGFIVAGARRVVASNWLVDDEAAASLISYYCGGIANTQKRGEPPDYAAALQQAKRWVRNQEKWSSPYYWATFVHVGPR
ncbi:MAG: CHAT domain-containing protein [Pirellulaceae bacterium]